MNAFAKQQWKMGLWFNQGGHLRSKAINVRSIKVKMWDGKGKELVETDTAISSDCFWMDDEEQQTGSKVIIVICSLAKNQKPWNDRSSRGRVPD